MVNGKRPLAPSARRRRRMGAAQHVGGFKVPNDVQNVLQSLFSTIDPASVVEKLSRVPRAVVLHGSAIQSAITKRQTDTVRRGGWGGEMGWLTP